MTSHKAQIQALINEINEVLSKPSPRLPFGRTGDTEQQRQVLEQTRSYLDSLQRELAEADNAGLPDSPLTYNLNYPQGQAPAVESAQQVLQAVLQEMTYLRSNVMQPLRSDVAQLQQQREALLHEVRSLEAQRQQYALPPAQVNQQQIITEFLQSLMGRLQENLTGQVVQMVAHLEAQSEQERAALAGTPANTPLISGSDQSVLSPQQRLEQLQALQFQSDQLLLRLDSTLRVIFESLQSNIQSYQESLSQGLDKMHNLGQQGEAMFAALVNRLAQQLGREASTYLQSSIQSADWETSGRPLPATVPPQVIERSPFILDTTSALDAQEEISEAQIDLLLNELQADEPVTTIQPPITSIQSADPLVQPDLNESDLSTSDLPLSANLDDQALEEQATPFQIDDDMTFFQVDEPLTSLQFDDEEMTQLQADLDAAVESVDADLLAEQDFEDADSTLDLLNQLSAELQSEPLFLTDQGVETSDLADSGLVGSDLVGEAIAPQKESSEPNAEPDAESVFGSDYDAEMTELYQSLFGSTAISSSSSADSPDDTPLIDQHVADAQIAERSELSTDGATLEPIDTPPEDVAVDSVSPSDLSDLMDASDQIDTPLVEMLFDGLTDPAAAEVLFSDEGAADGMAVTSEGDVFLSAPPPESLDELLGELLFPESELVGDSVAGWQDEINVSADVSSDVEVITSLSDLIISPEVAIASDLSEELHTESSSSQLDDDAFVPAAPDEVLLVSEDDLIPEAPVDIRFNADTLSQLTRDLSNLESRDSSSSSDLEGANDLELSEPDLSFLLDDADLADEGDRFNETELNEFLQQPPLSASTYESGYDSSINEELQPPVDLFSEFLLEQENATLDRLDDSDNLDNLDNLNNLFDITGSAEPSQSPNVPLPTTPLPTTPPFEDLQEWLTDLASTPDPISSTELTTDEMVNSSLLADEDLLNNLFSDERSPNIIGIGEDHAVTTDTPETGIPETEAFETEVFETEVFETEAFETEVFETDTPEIEAFESNADDVNANDVNASAEFSESSLSSLPPELFDELFAVELADFSTEPLPERPADLAEPNLEADPDLSDLSALEPAHLAQIEQPIDAEQAPTSTASTFDPALVSLPPASAALLATDTAIPSVSIPLEDDATLDNIFAAVPLLPTPVEDELTAPAASIPDTPFLDDLFADEMPIDVAAVDLPLRASSESRLLSAPQATQSNTFTEIDSIPASTALTEDDETNAFTLEGLAESLFEDVPNLESSTNLASFQPESEDWTLEGAFEDLGQAPSLPSDLDASALLSLEELAAEEGEKKKTVTSEGLAEVSPLLKLDALDELGEDEVTPLNRLTDLNTLADLNAVDDLAQFNHSEVEAALAIDLSLEPDLDSELSSLSLEPTPVVEPAFDELSLDNELSSDNELSLDKDDHASIPEAEIEEIAEVTASFEDTESTEDASIHQLDALEINHRSSDDPLEDLLDDPLDKRLDPLNSSNLGFEEPNLEEPNLEEELDLEELDLEELDLEDDIEQTTIWQRSPTSDLKTADLQTSDLLELSEDLGIDAQELKALLETDFAAEEFSPPPVYSRSEASPKVWYLGIDFGTTGVSAVLVNRLSLELYPIYWSIAPQAGGDAEKRLRLPTLVYLSAVDRPAATTDFAMDFIAQNNRVTVTFPAAHQQSEVVSPSVDPAQRLLRDFKPYLNVGIPHYSPETSQWEPGLQWAGQPLSLSAIHQAVRSLLSTLSIHDGDSDPAMPISAAVGLDENGFQSALRQLAGVTVGCPVGWADTYGFNLREAILGAQLVTRPDQIFVVEDAIAALLSALPSAEGRSLTLPAGVAQNPEMHNMDWQGFTLVINAGATATDLALVSLPQNLQMLKYPDFHLRSLPYAGNALDQDIICHLIYPAWLQRSRQTSDSPTEENSLNYTFGSGNGAKSGSFVDGWNWQPADASSSSEQIWHSLGLENLPLPLVGEPDMQSRFVLQQRLSSSPLGQGLLEAARHLKLTLQHQDRFVLRLGDQQLAIARQDLSSIIFLPYIQRLNRELNALMNQTGITAAVIDQVICTGGTASLAAIARWLPQKFPNATTIIQDTYGGDRASSPFNNCLSTCSRVAYGLAALPLHSHVLDLARQQYSPYFLLLELLRAFPDQPLSVGAVMQLLERRGINTQVCHQQILSLLEGQLPAGLVPSEKYGYLLTPESAQNPDYRLLLSTPLFSKHGNQTYRLNYDQWNHFRRYLGTLMTSTHQKLAEPLAISLSL